MKRPVTAMLAGLVLLVWVATMVAAFVPLVDCSVCNGTGLYLICIAPRGTVVFDEGDWVPHSCKVCVKRGKTTLVKKWTHRTATVGGGEKWGQ